MIRYIALLLFAFNAHAQELPDPRAFSQAIEWFNDVKNKTCSPARSVDFETLKMQMQLEESLRSAFCSDPFESICGYVDNNFEKRRERVAKAKAEIRKKALADTARHFGKDPLEFSELDILKLGKRVFEANVYFGAKVQEYITKRFQKAEDHLKKSTLLLKSTLIRAISKQVASDKLHPATGVAMTLKVTQIRTVMATDLLQSKGLSKEGKEKLMQSYNTWCGTDGLWNNAFASVCDDKPCMVVCPGWLLGAPEWDWGARMDTQFLNLLAIVAHELGHHIDAGNFYDTYKEYGRCITNEFAPKLTSEQLKLGSESPHVKILRTGHVSEKEIEYFTRYYAWTHPRFNEIIADFWAGAGVAQYLVDNKDSLVSYSKKIDVLRHAYVGWCNGTGSDGIHPDARFRIEVLLRRNPQIHEMMNCEEKSRAPKPACTFKGPSKETLF